MKRTLILSICFVSCAAVSFAAGSISSTAQDQSVPMKDLELLAHCTSQDAGRETCRVFINGVRSGMSAQRHFIGNTLLRQGPQLSDADRTRLLAWLVMNEPFCSSAAVSNEQLISEFVAFMEKSKIEYPDDVGKTNAGLAVLMAGQRALHCSSDAPTSP